MIPRECKRLAEVDFPIAVVSKHAVREKNIRHGHPSTLHLWWARRPLASCRAMLLALLLPDPCDPHCPQNFKAEARELLGPIPGDVGTTDEELREALLRFIGDFANWGHAASPTFLDAGRGLVKSAHPDEAPLVVDPFAGGGSIPLEATRLGCDAFASDLNPVACLILKTMLEDIPRHGPGFADELRRVAAEIKAAVEKDLTRYYPPDLDSSRPIAYLWARTVRCEQPHCGAEIPLVRSFWLSKKPASRRALRYYVQQPQGASPRAIFEIFAPKSEDEVPRGTVTRAKAVCLCCSTPLSPKTLNPVRVRQQLSRQRGGADVVFDVNGVRVGGATLLAVVTIHPGTMGRQYRIPTSRDYDAAFQAQTALNELLSEEKEQGFHAIPDETIPLMSGTFNVPLYGMTQWDDLFTARQKLSLLVLGNHLRTTEMSADVRDCLGLAYSRWTDIFNALCQWESSKTQVRHLFTRQALPMLWDFAENCIGSDQAGDFSVTLSTMMEVIEALSCIRQVGQTQQADAKESPIPNDAANVWFTDPPYYFAVPYADLSDFFYVWMKRVLPNHPLMKQGIESNNALTPKEQELCEMAHWDPVRYPHKDKEFFENGMREAFTEGDRVLRDDGIGCVVFAHKTTEGWEALLSGMVKGGWVITASWPIATEATTRPRARDSAALATSVHLVCRPRTDDIIGDWAGVLRELPERVGEWMRDWSGRGCEVQISSLPASAQRLKSSAATPGSKTPTTARFRLPNISRRFGRWSAGPHYTRSSARPKRKRETVAPVRSKKTRG